MIDITKQFDWVVLDGKEVHHFATWKEALEYSKGPSMLMTKEYYDYHWLPEHETNQNENV